MSAANKDTIYIDIDDEITGIIDKVESSQHKIVALVLPKRAAVLQSMVNMKLLKRTAAEADKKLVLITSEASLMSLAGTVGLHVAKTLQSKPVIPAGSQLESDLPVDADLDDEAETEDDKPLDPKKPVGALAGATATKPAAASAEETIELDNTTSATDGKAGAAASASAKAKSKSKDKDKKLKVPNFNKFRTRLFIGGGALILLLIAWYVATFVMPRANIVLTTNTTSVSRDIAFSTQPGIEEVDIDSRIVPARPVEISKTDSEKVTATGEEDRGRKASGRITIRNCDYADGFTIASGSTFVSGGKSYISTESVTVPRFRGTSSSCNLSSGSSGKATVDVQAAEPGEDYNIGSSSFSIPGISSSSKVDAIGGSMSGGSSNVVKVVSPQDITRARAAIEQRINTEIEPELTEELDDQGYYALNESLIIGAPEFTASPEAGQEGGEVTVTSKITYTMIGVKKEHLETLIEDSMKDELDSERQAIRSTGIDEAVIRLRDKNPDGSTSGTISSLVIVGPEFNLDNFKEEIAGQKRSPTEEFLKNQPGVTDVRVDYSPFWVFSTPKQTDKINITLEEPSEDSDEASQ